MVVENKFNALTAWANLTKARKTSKSGIVQCNLRIVATQMKALDEYIVMALFVLLLKGIHFLENKT